MKSMKTKTRATKTSRDGKKRRERKFSCTAIDKAAKLPIKKSRGWNE